MAVLSDGSGSKFVDLCFGNKVPEVKRANRSLGKSKSKGCYLRHIGCCAIIIHIRLFAIDVSALIFSVLTRFLEEEERFNVNTPVLP